MRLSHQHRRGTRLGARPSFEILESRVALAVVNLLINDTAATTDDLTLFNPATSAEPFVQTVPMEVVNTGPAVTLKLVCAPAGAVTFNVDTLTLAKDGTASVTITPASVSKAVGDITIEAQVGAAKRVEGSQKMTDVSVIVPVHVRNSDTPAAMTADRIPPRTKTTLPVMVTPDLGASGLTVSVTAAGQSADNGQLTINGAATASLTKTTDIDLVGTTQTAATAGAGGGNAGNLTLVAQVRGQNTVRSGGFSVAAIPQNFSDTFLALINDGTNVGIKVKDTWESDSGVLADLDQAMLSEQVQGTIPGGTSGYLPANMFSTDSHTISSAAVKAGPAQTFTFMQVNIFRDLRTGSTNIPMTNSGYIITQRIFKDPANMKFTLETIKKGADTTANGFSSKAGVTAPNPIDKTQVPV